MKQRRQRCWNQCSKERQEIKYRSDKQKEIHFKYKDTDKRVKKTNFANVNHKKVGVARLMRQSRFDKEYEQK